MGMVQAIFAIPDRGQGQGRGGYKYPKSFVHPAKFVKILSTEQASHLHTPHNQKQIDGRPCSHTQFWGGQGLSTNITIVNKETCILGFVAR